MLAGLRMCPRRLRAQAQRIVAAVSCVEKPVSQEKPSFLPPGPQFFRPTTRRSGIARAKTLEEWLAGYSSLMKIIVRWLLLAAALLLVDYLYSGVSVKSFGAAMVAALVLGLLNSLLRPILVLLTLPVTLLTLGLFLFVINALMFWAAAAVLDGFKVSGFTGALLGSLIYSVFSLVIESALERLFSKQ